MIYVVRLAGIVIAETNLEYDAFTACMRYREMGYESDYGPKQ